MVDISGYEGLYAITSCGKVWSYRSNKFLKPVRKRKGYLSVHLCDEAGNIKTCFIHRLVANAYLPNPNCFPQVNHKDENKSNNCLNNLEWCSAQYNNDYSKSKQIKCVETGEVFKSAACAARKLKLHKSGIYRVLTGQIQKTNNLKFIYI